MGQHRDCCHGHLRSRLAGRGAGDHPANALHLARRGGDVALGADRGLRHLGVLHILRLRRARAFRHVHGATADEGAAGCIGSKFRNGRPYRHRNLSRLGDSGAGSSGCLAPHRPETQSRVPATIALASYGGRNLPCTRPVLGRRPKLCRIGTERARTVTAADVGKADLRPRRENQLSGRSNRLPGVPLGGARPRCCQPRSFRQRPRAVRATRPSWIR